MNSRAIKLILVLSILGLSLFAAGCSNTEGNEWERLVCEVESVNSGAPLVSAYLDVGGDGMSGTDDDSFPIDWVPVLFRARPYSTAITIPEDAAHSWFHITGYNLTWTPNEGAPAGLTDYNVVNGYCDLIVPVHDEGVVSVLIADRQMKEEAWYRALYLDPTLSYSANCRLDFTGHESGSEKEVTVSGGMVVTFYGAVSTN